MRNHTSATSYWAVREASHGYWPPGPHTRICLPFQEPPPKAAKEPTTHGAVPGLLLPPNVSPENPRARAPCPQAATTPWGRFQPVKAQGCQRGLRRLDVPGGLARKQPPRLEGASSR
jgi:hypothetical protein